MIRLAFLLMTISTPVFAADFEFKVSRIAYTYDMMSAIVKTTNTSDSTVKLALVACTFMDQNNDPIGIGNFVISKMKAEETRFDEPFILGKHDVSSVSCQAKNVSFD